MGSVTRSLDDVDPSIPAARQPRQAPFRLFRPRVQPGRRRRDRSAELDNSEHLTLPGDEIPRATDYEESVASRKLMSASRGSQVGFVPDPFRRVEVRFESRNEREQLQCLISSPFVKAVREQQKIRYVDANGGGRHYTFDVVVDWTSGITSACETKYAADALRKDTRGRLEGIFEGRQTRVADDWRLLHENHFDEVTLENAREINYVACGDDAVGIAALRADLPPHGTVISMRDLSERAGLGRRGYRAAIVLIQSGTVRLEPGVRIDPETLVTIHTDG
ncbi:hypothetical protein [Aureimonas pseudogalii]|uniref:TnsA endonuclease N-terminal domain-containing protein n=1 Tax=Aureimonas pseudogalii TaxID=1744844 RepID=A0A7W6H4J2_9HYPH|nr:hypothetical protein [Aureimonas pseudogalii]MBB3998358.1 hypothetical protein [Aureimonas pseudogalii]